MRPAFELFGLLAALMLGLFAFERIRHWRYVKNRRESREHRFELERQRKARLAAAQDNEDDDGSGGDYPKEP